MWVEMIAELCKHCKVNPPLSAEWIDRGLDDLDVILHEGLRSFLLETNGLYDYKQFLWIVWNVRDLSAYNKEMRQHKAFADKGYQVEDIFFISNKGTDGILYGFPIVKRTLQEEIISWHPATNERRPIADNLEMYIKHWINGNR